jgi:hypothetical protein
MDLKVRREAEDLLDEIADSAARIREECGDDTVGQFLTCLKSRIDEMIDEAAEW